MKPFSSPFFLQEDINHWQTVFYIAAGVYSVGNLLYVLMASGEEQPWNKIDNSDGQPCPIVQADSQDMIGDVY